MVDWEQKLARFAQNTAQTVIGNDLKTLPAFIKVLAGRRCVNKPTARLVMSKFINRRIDANFVLV